MVERSNPPHASTGSVALNGFRFDLDANELFDAAGALVRLRPRSLAVLRSLARSAGRVVDKEELIREVWPDAVVTDDSLVQCIGELRQALGDAQHRTLQTEPKRGYRLVPSTAKGAEPAPGSGDDAGVAQEVRFATTADGVRIAYACHGAGVPVVRAAGEISHLDDDLDCLTEGPILRAVARRHRLIRFDQRGQGLSDRSVPLLDLEDSVRDLQAVVDAAGLSRFVLWSIGAGAGAAIRFAAQHPERVERLILSAGWARGAASRKDAIWMRLGAAQLETIEGEWGFENCNVRVDRLMSGGTSRYPGATLEQVHSHDRMLLRACSPSCAASAIRVAAEFDVSADLGRVRCPTLVTHCRHSRITPFDEVRLMAAGIPGARLVTLDSQSHMPLPQEPAFDELVRLIDDFIAQTGAARADTGGRGDLRADAAPALRLVAGGRGREGANRR